MSGLYVHIPFCVRRCHYCHFISNDSNTAENHEEYLDSLKIESEYVRKVYGELEFDTVYIGGGTPSALSGDEFKELFYILKKYFSWKSSSEITCEVNPGEVDREKAAVYRELGINRISIGAQTFNDRQLASLGRIHSSRRIHEIFHLLESMDFDNINIDLMIALPGQTPQDASSDIEQIAALSPQHVSLYELEIDEGTEFYKRYRSGKIELPSQETQLNIYKIVNKMLPGLGFAGYALSCYAKPDFESRHNINYWNNGEYLGLGPGAFSYLKNKRFQRSQNYSEHIQKMRREDWSLTAEESLDHLKKDSESFLLGLRMAGGVSLERFNNYLEYIKKDVEELINSGLLEQKDGYLRITNCGAHVAETIFCQLSSPSL